MSNCLAAVMTPGGDELTQVKEEFLRELLHAKHLVCGGLDFCWNKPNSAGRKELSVWVRIVPSSREDEPPSSFNMPS